MARFIGTFGTQYGREEHPAVPGITGNHYVLVIADNLAEAHQLMDKTFNQAWAFIYPAEEYSSGDLEKFYPAGSYGILKTDGWFTDLTTD